MSNKNSNSILTTDLLVASTPTPKANRAQSIEHHLIPFHAALHQDLRSASLTQRDVAKILGVSQQSVSKWRKNNYLPMRHRNKLVALLRERLGKASQVVQSFQTDQLESSMGPHLIIEHGDPNHTHWTHQTLGAHRVRVKKHPKNQGRSRGKIKPTKNVKLLNHEPLDTHNSWLTEATRQFIGVKTHSLYRDPAGIQAVFDLVMPETSTYITCTGTFTGYTPVRELISYSAQLVKLCAMYANSARNDQSNEPIRIVILNGIYWRDTPTESELETKKWLECAGISMIHVRNYMEAMVAVSHFYHQQPNVTDQQQNQSVM